MRSRYKTDPRRSLCWFGEGILVSVLVRHRLSFYIRFMTRSRAIERVSLKHGKGAQCPGRDTGDESEMGGWAGKAWPEPVEDRWSRTRRAPSWLLLPKVGQATISDRPQFRSSALSRNARTKTLSRSFSHCAARGRTPEQRNPARRGPHRRPKQIQVQSGKHWHVLESDVPR